MSTVTLEAVSKCYGQVVALDDVSLTFADGVTTALVGQSGSGKSTLLKLINGLIRPTAGRVVVFDQLVGEQALPLLRKRMGYAVQRVGLFPHLTVFENVGLPAKLAGWRREHVEARVRELLRSVHLDAAHLHRYPHELSGGQQQRVGLCRALILDPPVMLLDEPFGALDAATRLEIHQEFMQLQRMKPRTIVLVTHDLSEAEKLAQRIVVLEKGRVLEA